MKGQDNNQIEYSILFTSFIVKLIPFVAKFSITSTAFSIFNLTKGSSSFFHLLNTKSACNPLGYSLPMPNRKRGYSLEATTASTLRKPLCPPSLPEGRSRIFERGNATSSVITKVFSKAIFSLSIQYFTALPLKFIYVVGQMQTKIFPFQFTSATYASLPGENLPPCFITKAFTP